ncbi:BTAD domain-containing putative transcriptional regulator [Gordonia sp. i37]|uniref:AfsR/SARP family transcriptional regulator n=1 Tax=Gordonia sp. i37 TaxID=1961707 RepID=UPI00209B2593|nr:BTAD domain-containing putative transcriptional regulator [Gordonia sp. i37]
MLAQALAQWRGPAYSDIEGWGFAEIEATRLAAVRADAVDDHLAATSACGDHESVIVELSALLRADPLREKRWELLALAQYRAGRQAQALESLRTARGVLADEIGADPGPSLVALQEAILRHDPGLIVDVEHDARARLGRHIPVALTSFVGRRDDLADIERALGTDRLVTLTGPGGIGKTRLAMAVAAARSDHDGPWFVEASGTRDHDSLVEATTRVLGVTASGGVDVLTALLSSRRTLLVLDNCEHVAGEVAKLVLALLTGCPACGCSPPAGCGSVFPVSMSTLSDRCARPQHCSPNAPLALRVPRIRPTSSPCVRLSTICLWQSNSLPRGPRCCRCDNCTTC